MISPTVPVRVHRVILSVPSVEGSTCHMASRAAVPPCPGQHVPYGSTCHRAQQHHVTPSAPLRPGPILFAHTYARCDARAAPRLHGPTLLHRLNRSCQGMKVIRAVQAMVDVSTLLKQLRCLLTTPLRLVGQGHAVLSVGNLLALLAPGSALDLERLAEVLERLLVPSKPVVGEAHGMVRPPTSGSMSPSLILLRRSTSLQLSSASSCCLSSM